jgi:uncharacterized protein DUF6526
MQNYQNHVHRPVLTGVGFFFLVVSLVQFGLRWFGRGGRGGLELGLLSLAMSVLVLLVISRDYITRLQDRIIKLEMRVRTASILTREQQQGLFQLSNKQIAALRFASDGELAGLLERTIRERLKPNDIKRAVKTWVPDLDRT